MIARLICLAILGCVLAELLGVVLGIAGTLLVQGKLDPSTTARTEKG